MPSHATFSSTCGFLLNCFVRNSHCIKQYFVLHVSPDGICGWTWTHALACLTHLCDFHKHEQCVQIILQRQSWRHILAVICELGTGVQFLLCFSKNLEELCFWLPKTYLKHNSVASFVLEMASLRQWFCQVCLSRFLPQFNRLRK